MYRLLTLTWVITMIATILFCVSIANAQSTSEEKLTKDPEGNLNTERTFGYFTNGDDNLQSFNFLFKLPLNEPPFKLDRIEGSLSGKYFVTFSKPNLPDDISIWNSFLKQFSDMRAVSESFALRLETSTLTPVTLGANFGGYIELESDYSINTDPHLHFTGYLQYNPVSFVKAALGGWAEAQRLRKEPRDDGRYRYGLRAHLDIEHNTKRITFSMMIEYLPHLSFDKYRVSASPEFELKFKAFGKQLGLVFHTEIDYYSENTDLTVEPLLDLKPLEIRWTQLIRHRF